ncbi:MAG: diguanylate cyclase [Treponema sp.]|nr:diguanylate cyclase [Treponema sp.]
MNLFFYAGLDKESYRQIHDEMIRGNSKNILGFSAIVAFSLFCLTIYAMISGGAIYKNVPTYIATCVIFITMFVINKTLGKKHPMVVMCSVYIFMMALLVFGIYMGVFLSPKQATVSFIAIMMTLAGLFYVKPIGFIGVILTSVVVYLILATRLLEGTVLTANLVNSVTYGFLSLATGTYIMTIKASKYHTDRINEFLSLTDQMTGLGNRRKFEAKLDELRKYLKPVTVITMDINNLKKTNDTLGHKAGDELIKGSVECILATFGKHGESFRTGGDEFVTFTTDISSIEKELTEEFMEKVKSWKGKTVHTLSISFGLISSTDHPEMNIDELVTESDRLMYEAKANYYRTMRQEKRK